MSDAPARHADKPPPRTLATAPVPTFGKPGAGSRNHGRRSAGTHGPGARNQGRGTKGWVPARGSALTFPNVGRPAATRRKNAPTRRRNTIRSDIWDTHGGCAEPGARLGARPRARGMDPRAGCQPAVPPPKCRTPRRDTPEKRSRMPKGHHPLRHLGYARRLEAEPWSGKRSRRSVRGCGTSRRTCCPKFRDECRSRRDGNAIGSCGYSIARMVSRTSGQS